MIARTLAAALLLAATAARADAPPLTLDDALAEATRQSHDLAIAKADLRSAGADSVTAWAGVLPRLDLSASGGRQFLGPSADVQVVPIIGAGGVIIGYEQRKVSTPATDFEAYGFSLKLVQPLFDGLATWKQISQAKAADRAAARTFDESRLSVTFEVTRLFYELVKAERSLQVLEKTAQRSEELVERSDALFQAGRAVRADTITARVNLGNDRIAVEEGRARVARARADLAVALGRPGDEPLSVVAPAALGAPGLPATDVPPVDVLMARARERRPALAAQAALVEAADAGVGVARSGYWPSLAAQVTYGRSGPELTGPNGVFGDPTLQYSAVASLVLSWNLFDGRRTLAAVDRAAAGYDRAVASAAKNRDSVAREVTTSRVRLETLGRQAALAVDNLKAAEQGLDLARQRLEAGLASQLEVRDASLKLTQAELLLVQTRIDHAVAVADLNRAVGGAL